MIRLLAIVVVLAGLVCGALAWSAGTTLPRADFTFINRGDNKTLDPNSMSWMQDIRLAYALWEGLYSLDAMTMHPMPGVADTVQISPDQRTYTFHIRDDAKWSNGEPVRPQDFIFEWRRMLETPGEYTYLHHYIQGAEAYENAFSDYVAARAAHKPATPPDFATVGEKILDASTLQVTLKQPVGFFPSLCAFPPFLPMHEPSMRKFAKVDAATGQTTYDQAFTRPPNLVTDGPYRLDLWTFKRSVRMVANEYYWDKANVKSKTIEQVYVDDPLAAYRLYDQGQVDWLCDVEPDIAAGIMKNGGRPDLHVFLSFGTYYYDYNCQPKLPDGRDNPLADKRVRQALTMSIDKRPIVRDVTRMGEPITSDYIPPGVFPGYISPPGLPYDVEKARALLAEAGYPNGKGFPRLSILYNSEFTHSDVATIIHRQWLDALGIDMDLEGVELKQFGNRKHNRDFDIGRGGWYGDYNDPSTFTDKYLTRGDNNDGLWSNPEYDAICAQAAIEPDQAKRLVLFNKAENILLNDAAIAPLYVYTGKYMFRSNVHGISLTPQQTTMFKGIFRDAPN